MSFGVAPKPPSRLTPDEQAALAKPATAKRLAEIRAKKAEADQAIAQAAAARAEARQAETDAKAALDELAVMRERIANLDAEQAELAVRKGQVERQEAYLRRKMNGE